MHHHRKIDLDKLAAAHTHGARSTIVVAPHEQFEWVTASADPIALTWQSADAALEPACLLAQNGMAAKVNAHAQPGWIGYYSLQHPHGERVVEVQIAVASGMHAVCEDFTARQNQYFIWYNDSSEKIHIEGADIRHKPHFWHAHGYNIPAHGSIAVLVPPHEPVGFYELKVTSQHGDACSHRNSNPAMSVARA